MSEIAPELYDRLEAYGQECGIPETDWAFVPVDPAKEDPMHDIDSIRTRLEELRGEIRAERISYAELAELQGLAEHIDPLDVELLEWAGVPEHSVRVEGTS